MLKNSTPLEVTSIVREIPSHLQGKKIGILTKKLENRINHSASLPIEYLESKLFDISHTYFISLNSPKYIISTFFYDQLRQTKGFKKILLCNGYPRK